MMLLRYIGLHLHCSKTELCTRPEHKAKVGDTKKASSPSDYCPRSDTRRSEGGCLDALEGLR